MIEAERKLFSRNRKRAGFRAALLSLFAAEAAAFVHFIGAASLSDFAVIAGVAGLLLLPLVALSFGGFRFGAAFYAIFLFTFAFLFALPYFAAEQANAPLRAAVSRVKPGMTRQQAEKTLFGYVRKNTPFAVELLHLNASEQTGLCGLSFNTSTKFYANTRGPLAYSDCAEVAYDRRGQVYSVYFAPGAYHDGLSLKPVLRPIRAFFWLFTQDCSYDSAND